MQIHRENASRFILRFALAALAVATSAGATNFTITAQSSLTFSPPTVTIQVGDTVTFQNVGGGFHNVAADDGSFVCSEDCTPSGGQPSTANWSFIRTFNTAGTVGFHCQVHGFVGGGMHGTITVAGSPPPPPPAGSLQFSLAAYSVGEGTSTATIAVTRTGGSGGAVGVHYAATAGTATAGSDFTATSGTLSWADGDSAAKTFGVTIKNDTLVESTETVHLALGSPTGGAALGLSSATLSILDNDSGGGGGTAPAACQADRDGNRPQLCGAQLAGQIRQRDVLPCAGPSFGRPTSRCRDGGQGQRMRPRCCWTRTRPTNSAFAPSHLGVSAFRASRAQHAASPAPCVADATTLCLGSGGRFRARINWRDPSGPGPGTAIPLPANPDSGLYWFFASSNIEALLKVLNACALTPSRYWVFFAATTNVEFTLRVTDTASGKQHTYFNPLNQAAAPVQDTNAFATCP